MPDIDSQALIATPHTEARRELKMKILTIDCTELFPITTLFGGNIQNFSKYPLV